MPPATSSSFIKLLTHLVHGLATDIITNFFSTFHLCSRSTFIALLLRPPNLPASYSPSLRRRRFAPFTITAGPPLGRPAAGPPSSPPSNARVAAVVLSYGLSSLGGVFVNKTCLSSFNFNNTISLLLAQLIVSVSALTLLRLTGIVHIPSRSGKDLSVLIVPAAFFIANVTVGLIALKLVNIPMFSAFRRLSVLSVMLLEWLVLGKTASTRILGIICIMVLGSFLAGLGDVSYHPMGYALVFANNFITAANLVSIKKASALLSLDALPLFYYVSVLSLPIVFLLALVSGELQSTLVDIATRPELQTFGFVVAMSLSAASAFLINFFTNMCTQITSPLTTAITGQMKNVLQTVLGIFAFGYVVTPLNLFGLGVALFGSLLFARQKYLDGRLSAAQQKRAVLEQSPEPPTSSSSAISLQETTEKPAALQRHGGSR